MYYINDIIRYTNGHTYRVVSERINSDMYAWAAWAGPYDRLEDFLTPEQVERYHVLRLLPSGTSVPGVGYTTPSGNIAVRVREG